MTQTLVNMLTKLGITKGQDKVLHALAGFVIGGISVVMFYKTIWPLVAVVVAGGGKEVYDKYIKKSEADFFDLFATVIGGFAGIVLIGLIYGTFV